MTPFLAACCLDTFSHVHSLSCRVNEELYVMRRHRLSDVCKESASVMLLRIVLYANIVLFLAVEDAVSKLLQSSYLDTCAASRRQAQAQAQAVVYNTPLLLLLLRLLPLPPRPPHSRRSAFVSWRWHHQHLHHRCQYSL
jgi:hypothetical protein